MNKPFRLIALKQNRDLPYLNERFEAGQLVPVIDGPYTLSDAREAFRHFGAGNHQGKIVFDLCAAERDPRMSVSAGRA
jgi:NADPH:quinone reductase-like Zn-dependent oxidoreductase